MKTLELKKGTLWYYDTVECGLVPCECTSVFVSKTGSYKAKAVVTEDCRAYKKGMEIEDFAEMLAPRKAVYIPKGLFFYRIRPYSYIVD